MDSSCARCAICVPQDQARHLGFAVVVGPSCFARAFSCPVARVPATAEGCYEFGCTLKGMRDLK